MDTSLPKVSMVDVYSGTTVPITPPVNNFQQPLNTAISKYKCPHKMPCGRCDLTKEKCNE